MAYANNTTSVQGEIKTLSKPIKSKGVDGEFTYRAGKIQVKYTTDVPGMVLDFTIRDRDGAENLAKYSGVGHDATLLGSLHSDFRSIKDKDGVEIASVRVHRLRVVNAQYQGKTKRS